MTVDEMIEWSRAEQQTVYAPETEALHAELRERSEFWCPDEHGTEYYCGDPRAPEWVVYLRKAKA